MLCRLGLFCIKAFLVAVSNRMFKKLFTTGRVSSCPEEDFENQLVCFGKPERANLLTKMKLRPPKSNKNRVQSRPGRSLGHPLHTERFQGGVPAEFPHLTRAFWSPFGDPFSVFHQHFSSIGFPEFPEALHYVVSDQKWCLK